MNNKKNKLNLHEEIDDVVLPLPLKYLDRVEQIINVRDSALIDTSNSFYKVDHFQGIRFYKPISKF